MQQINLYLPEFRPHRQPVRAVHMGWALLALAVLLLLWSFWSVSRTQALSAQVEREEAQLGQLEEQVRELSERQPRRRGPDLETEIDNLQREIRRREDIKLLITRQNLGNAEGFSGQMRALARQALSDLALEQFSLREGGGYVELSGRVRSAELVPRYLQRLRDEDSFARARFGVLEVAEDEAPAPGLMFSLRRFEAGDKQR